MFDACFPVLEMYICLELKQRLEYDGFVNTGVVIVMFIQNISDELYLICIYC